MMAVSIFALSLIQCIPFLYVQLMLCPIIALLIVSNKVEENQHIQVLSRVYLGAISLNVILLTVGDVSFYYGKLGTALSFNLASYILSICLLILHTCYGLYCHMNMGKIIAAAEFNDNKQRRKKKSNNNNNSVQDDYDRMFSSSQDKSKSLQSKAQTLSPSNIKIQAYVERFQ